MFTALEKQKECERELALRKHVYVRQVAAGRMKQENADRWTAIMQAIRDDYAAEAEVSRDEQTMELF